MLIAAAHYGAAEAPQQIEATRPGTVWPRLGLKRVSVFRSRLSIRTLSGRLSSRREAYLRKSRKEKTDMTNSANTIRLHRVLRAPVERVYRAFLDADAMAKWLPPHGFTGKVH